MDASDVPGAPRASYWCKEFDEGLSIQIGIRINIAVSWSRRNGTEAGRRKRERQGAQSGSASTRRVDGPLFGRRRRADIGRVQNDAPRGTASVGEAG